jgi:Ca-activated chloride channel family protein
VQGFVGVQQTASRALLLVGTLAIATGVGAEQAVPQFGVSTDLVVLSATAVDRKGRPVMDLQSDELRVFEEGEPQAIAHFTEAGGAKARMLLLVDISGSMEADEYKARTMAAARALLGAMGPEDEVGLSAFDREYWPVVPFTHDHDAILARLERIKPWGSTALHDALALAAAQLAEEAEGRRAIVVLTDGVDTASELGVEEAVARSRALDVPIYAVAVVSPLDDPRSPLYTGKEHPTEESEAGSVLQRYAALSGGQAFTVSDLDELGRVARTITSELDNQYRLGYRPPQGPAGYRRVEVRSTRKGVVVRTRRGYVAAR